MFTTAWQNTSNYVTFIYLFTCCTRIYIRTNQWILRKLHWMTNYNIQCKMQVYNDIHLTYMWHSKPKQQYCCLYASWFLHKQKGGNFIKNHIVTFSYLGSVLEGSTAPEFFHLLANGARARRFVKIATKWLKLWVYPGICLTILEL